MTDKAEFEKATQLFEDCSPVFIALGDPIRQKLILDLAEATINEKSLSVADLTRLTHLSRPAVSHHLKILKTSGIIEPLKVGTQIFYRLNLLDRVKEVKVLIAQIEKILSAIKIYD